MGTSLFVIEMAILGVVVIGAIAYAVTKGTGFARPLSTPVSTLPVVLLPNDPGAEDVDGLRFSLGLRGYRADQVDEVLDRLAISLAAKDAEIQRLKAAVPETQEPARGRSSRSTVTQPDPHPE